tara:strand:- start:10428 stop:11075 length:648 start_codon:yes stop_codon:yes gene_type:complete
MNQEIDFKNIRINYKKSKIDFNNLQDCPIALFLDWFREALRINKDEANACVLSTVSTNNRPSSRVVLVKEINKEGFTFFTNYKSDKSIDIDDNPNVSLNFYWRELERQVRICGIAKKISASDSDNYFNSRPRDSQIGAWLSDQSLSVSMDHNFMKDLDTLQIKFEGKEVERPLYWGGYCVSPRKVEFWQGRPSRLHHRLKYSFDGERWSKERLAP